MTTWEKGLVSACLEFGKRMGTSDVGQVKIKDKDPSFYFRGS